MMVFDIDICGDHACLLKKKKGNKFNPTLLLIFQIELGKGLGKDGLSIKALWEAGYESIFIGIGKISSIF